jgi:hypothetical protein
MVDEVRNREIAEQFDELIEAHELIRAAERSLEAYMAENSPPETPEVFENVEALFRYNAEKERYELGLSSVVKRKMSHGADYESAAAQVEPLLPEGSRLIHAYGGSSATIPRGKRYVVLKESALTDLSGGLLVETSAGEPSAVSYAVRVEELITGPG